MFEMLLAVLGGLGVGILVAFFVMLGKLFLGSERSDKMRVRLAFVASIVAWVAIITLQNMFPQPLWLWAVLYMVCWILDVVAWIFFQIFFSERD